MKFFKACLLIAGIVLFSAQATKATHLRAGEVIAIPNDCQSFSYTFRITLYVDLQGVEPGGGAIEFGDGESQTLEVGNPDIQRVIEGDVGEAIFIVEHSYAGPGTYNVAFREFNRNDLIVNMDNSVNTPLYLETQIEVGSSACNNSPILLNPPVDKGCTGVAYFHNPGAIDPDGDSLSYRFVIPRQDVNQEVINYQFPHLYDIENFNAQNEDMTGSANFSIDPITGTITWDAPGGTGEYNFAFVVEEWRQVNGRWVRLGYVTRDMQVIIEDCDNERPELILPEDTCVVAGDTLNAEIMAEDPDNHDITISTFSIVYQLLNNPATYSPDPEQRMPNPASMDFQWITNCSHISSNQYLVNFKAKDHPPPGEGPSLADFDTWLIDVVGPPPEWVSAAQGSGRRIELEWEDYACSNAQTIQIYRKVDSYPFEVDNCQLGIPENADYELIDVVDAGTTQYIDTHQLEYGIKYCYRLVATYEVPNPMESIVSEEICVEIEEQDDFNSLMTNVSVEETEAGSGEIFLKWTSPFDINPAIAPPPYSYEVYRGVGLNGNPSQLVSGGRISDTIFVDTGLNTQDNAYSYNIIAYDNNTDIVDTTLVSTSVWLDPSPLKGAIEIQWEANTAWTNFSANHPYHLIYRNNIPPNNSNELVLIDSVNVFEEGFYYFDNGQITGETSLNENTEYCYFVTTRGSYGNDKLTEPFLNNSQVVCVQPFDSISPCTPLELVINNLNLEGSCEELVDKPCDFDDFKNSLSWSFDRSGDCQQDVRSFNIYFSPTGLEEDYELIDNVRDTFYVHDNIDSYAGCYRIAAVDRSGNMSELTEAVCNDNCPAYFLPNVVTPNGDGFNDRFQAFNPQGNPQDINDDPQYDLCPRFVEKVKFQVFSRWGNEVYTYESTGIENSILINWDGKSNDGNPVSAGTYYYLATVTFNVLDPNKQIQEFKGWIKVDRGQ